MTREVTNIDPMVQIQEQIALEYRAKREQTASDRTYAKEFSLLEGEERAKAAGRLTLLAADNFTHDDIWKLADRFERLFASLSISTYWESKTELVTIHEIDSLYVIALNGIATISDPDMRRQQATHLQKARLNGLNPLLRTRHPEPVIEQPIQPDHPPGTKIVDVLTTV